MVCYPSLDNDKHYKVSSLNEESENVHLRNMTAFALNSSEPRLSVLPPSSGNLFSHTHVVRLIRKLTDTNHIEPNYTKAESQDGRRLELPKIASSKAESRVVRQLELPKIASSKAESRVVRQLELPENVSSEPMKEATPSHHPLVVQGKKQCNVNVSAIKSWQHGLVTQLEPKVTKDCSKLAHKSKHEAFSVKKQLSHWKNAESFEQYLQRMSECSNVRQEFSNNFYVSSEEETLPIAYIFVVYKNARQVVRLLKAIYRPQNLYCIHPDAKQGKTFAKVFHHISNCLNNVFVASRLEKVYYAHHSIMDAQLNCIHDLARYPTHKWKYVINLCGREVPLKTNREVVHSLMKLNGSSAVGAHLQSKLWWRERFSYKFALNHQGTMYKTHHHLGSVPSRIRMYKSMNFIAASRQFAHFLVTNEKAIALRKYLRDVYAPEEHFYASLYHLSEAPGARPKGKGIKVPTVSKFIWLTGHLSWQRRWEKCKGNNVHDICVVDSSDLPTISKYSSSSYFFLNKYFMEWDHVVMDCAEGMLVKKNKEEYQRDCVQ